MDDGDGFECGWVSTDPLMKVYIIADSLRSSCGHPRLGEVQPQQGVVGAHGELHQEELRSSSK